MSETPATYDCGATCTCDAVTDLAAERTELMEEMAAALEWLVSLCHGMSKGGPECCPPSDAEWKDATDTGAAVLAKYRGEGE